MLARQRFGSRSGGAHGCVPDAANAWAIRDRIDSAPPATGLLCNELSNLYATARQEINNITGSSIPGMSTVQSLANSFINLLPTTFPTLPFLNWNIGGIRIPVTAEAIVRMQSPVHSGDLP